MKALASDPKVISLANTLGVDTADPVEGIRTFCAERVRQFIRKRTVEDVRKLQEIVCAKLNLTVHDIWSDQDLDDLISSYVQQKRSCVRFLRQRLELRDLRRADPVE